MPNFSSFSSNSPWPDKLMSTENFNENERLYSAREVAKRLGVSERWVRDHATRRHPRIQAVKLGPLLRFHWRDVKEFLAELAVKNDSKHSRKDGSIEPFSTAKKQ